MASWGADRPMDPRRVGSRAISRTLCGPVHERTRRPLPTRLPRPLTRQARSATARAAEILGVTEKYREVRRFPPWRLASGSPLQSLSGLKPTSRTGLEKVAFDPSRHFGPLDAAPQNDCLSGPLFKLKSDRVQGNAEDFRGPGFARTDRHGERQCSSRNNFARAQRRIMRVPHEQFYQMTHGPQRAIEYESATAAVNFQPGKIDCTIS